MAIGMIINIFLILMLSLFIGVINKSTPYNLETFALHKKGFQSFALVSTIVASFIGGGSIIGMLSKILEQGWAPVVAFLGFPLQIYLTGKFIAPRLHVFEGMISLGELFKQHYGKYAQFLVGMLWVSFCTGILVVQIAAMGKTLYEFTGMNLYLSSFIVGGIVIIYCAVGGIQAVVRTDVFQFLVMGVLLVLIAFFAFQYSFQEKPVALHLSLTHSVSPLTIAATFLSFLLGDALIPPVIQRLSSASSPNIAAQSYKMSAFIIVLFTGLLWIIGESAKASGSGDGGSISHFLQLAMPKVMAGTWGMLLLAAIMSSADSYLNTGAVAFVNDLFVPFFQKKITGTMELRLARIITVVLGIIAIVFAVNTTDIFQTLLSVFKFWGPTVLIPLLFMIYGYTVSKANFFIGVILASLTVILWDATLGERLNIEGLIPGLSVHLMFYLAIKKYALSKQESLA